MKLVQIRMLTDAGVLDLQVDAGSRDSRLIGSHWNAVKRFLQNGDVDQLAPFEDESVDGHHPAVDPDWIEHWAYQGALDFEDIYESRP